MAALPDPATTLTGAGRAIYEDILTRRKAKGVDHLGPYVPLLNHPDLAKWIEHLGWYYKFESTLPRDVYQFVVLVFARRVGATFQWDDHVAAAQAAGLSRPLIDAIGAGATVFDPPFDAVHRLMDCAISYRSIPADVQAAAISRFGVHGLIEIVTLCGFYTMIAMVNSCFDVPLPARAHH